MSVYTINSRYNASIFNFGIFSGGKVNLVGAIGRVKTSSSFQKHRGKKNKEKREL